MISEFQHHKIDVDRNLVAVGVSGRLATEAVLAIRESICSDPSYRRDMNQLWDFSDVVEFALRPADLREVIERQPTGGFEGRMRYALVAPQDAGFGLSRMYEALTGEADFEVGVFRDRSNALAWVTEPEPR